MRVITTGAYTSSFKADIEFHGPEVAKKYLKPAIVEEIRKKAANPEEVEKLLIEVLTILCNEAGLTA